MVAMQAPGNRPKSITKEGSVRHDDDDQLKAFRQLEYLSPPLHIVPSSLDRARGVLDEAYQQARYSYDG